MSLDSKSEQSSRKENRKRKVKDQGSFGSENKSDESDSKRIGKWTDEEESFAIEVIKSFRNGKLRDCEIGCMLRSYLAKKLLCSPMRISKKFSGENQLGKV